MWRSILKLALGSLIHATRQSSSRADDATDETTLAGDERGRTGAGDGDDDAADETALAGDERGRAGQVIAL